MFLSNQDVQKQRVREQQNQLDRADFEKSTRRDQMVRTMNESEDRIMQKRWIQQRYQVCQPYYRQCKTVLSRRKWSNNV